MDIETINKCVTKIFELTNRKKYKGSLATYIKNFYNIPANKAWYIVHFLKCREILINGKGSSGVAPITTWNNKLTPPNGVLSTFICDSYNEYSKDMRERYKKKPQGCDLVDNKNTGNGLIDFKIVKGIKDFDLIGKACLIEQRGGELQMMTEISEAQKKGELTKKQAFDIKAAVTEACKLKEGVTTQGEQDNEMVQPKSAIDNFHSYMAKTNYDLNFMPRGERRNIVIKWLDYKASRGQKYKSHRSIELFYRELSKLSGGDCETMQDIVDRAVAYDWNSIFPVSNNEIAPSSAPIIWSRGLYKEEIIKTESLNKAENNITILRKKRTSPCFPTWHSDISQTEKQTPQYEKLRELFWSTFPSAIPLSFTRLSELLEKKTKTQSANCKRLIKEALAQGIIEKDKIGYYELNQYEETSETLDEIKKPNAKEMEHTWCKSEELLNELYFNTSEETGAFYVSENGVKKLEAKEMVEALRKLGYEVTATKTVIENL